MTKILVTGGAGFIGSNFVGYILKNYPDDEILVLDKMTYAGNPKNLDPYRNNPRFKFVKGDICDRELVDSIVRDGRFDGIINFAAETHVDRSIVEPEAFIKTDIMGTHVLLDMVNKYSIPKYLQISTDEVYGSILEGSFKETDPLSPSSPYSASKSGGDLLTLAYYTTYKTPILITRSSNNYGPNQYPEKVIPLFITNAIEDIPVPLYGDGMNVRDWIYVEDNCSAVDMVFRKGKIGEIYNIGAGHEIPNIVLTKQILSLMGKPETLIKPVQDRKGHDRRYSVDTTKIKKLGWSPKTNFDTGIKKTIDWYKENLSWWKKIKSGEFKEYYKKQYGL